MLTIDYIFNEFTISNEEYAKLDGEFGNLCYKAAWELKRKNFKNNYTDEIEDIVQELKISMNHACIYIKRQKYIEESFLVVEKFCNDPFIIEILSALKELWNCRKKHGANKQKFGEFQEKLLDNLLNVYVPQSIKPNKKSKLEIDERCSNYCKAAIWNRSKNLGKKITRERGIRSGMVSLSEYAYLAGCEEI